jgi:hypothetical protein
VLDSRFQLAQINIARMVAPLTDPVMTNLVAKHRHVQNHEIPSLPRNGVENLLCGFGFATHHVLEIPREDFCQACRQNDMIVCDENPDHEDEL